MFYILSHKKTSKSSRILARTLSEILNKKVVSRTEPIDGQLIAIFGNSLFQALNCKLNSPGLIRIAANKLATARLFTEKNISCIELHKGIPDKFPVIVRTILGGSKGIGIKISENKEDFIQNHYNDYHWSYYYPFQFELGVHILGGEIKKVFKKVRDDGLEDEKYPIRNSERGYKFSLRENWKEYYKGLDEFIKKIYDKFPIQFCRLDIGFDKSSGGYRLIEINSAPDLSQNENTLNMYAKFISERIGG